MRQATLKNLVLQSMMVNFEQSPLSGADIHWTQTLSSL